MHPRRWFQTALTTAIMIAGMCIIATAAYRSSPAYAGAPGAPPASCAAPIDPVTLVNPTVLTTCTQAALQAVLTNGGHITFDCGPNPVTIPITSPLVTSATRDIVLDGKGLITLDGGGVTRILEKPFTPGSHIDKTSGNDLVIQNMRFINGRAPAATKTQDDKARGGAIWVTSPGTRLHIINSVFEHNRTTSITDEDNQGGAIYAGNIYETIIVGSVFIDNEAGSGGAFGGIATGFRYSTRASATIAPPTRRQAALYAGMAARCTSMASATVSTRSPAIPSLSAAVSSGATAQHAAAAQSR